MIGKWIKHLIRRSLAAAGYTVRGIGRGVGGIDLLHDARTLLRGASGHVLFDVGANIGQTTLAMLAAFRSPRIYSFEPSPASRETLRRAVGSRSGVTIEALAMGDVPGNLPFHVTRDHSVNDSLLAPSWDAGSEVIQVPVETIDGYCQRHRIDSIDLLKIDTQGFDLQVLKGARQMLAARRIKLYSCEAMVTHKYDGQTTLRELLAFGDEVGFNLVGFFNQSYINNRLSFLDLLFHAG